MKGAFRILRQRGFSLLTATVLVAVVIIGVGLALPLANRHQDARRRVQTRMALERAFRGLFPYPTGSPGADLRTDFGFSPTIPTQLVRPDDATLGWTLRGLIDPSGVGALDPNRNPPALFNGTNAGSAWNGPYWQGSLDASGLPVDAWGRAIELRYVTSPSAGWIVHSPGSNGLDDTAAGSGTPGGDDLVYPTPPYVLASAAFDVFTVSFNFHFVLLSDDVCLKANNVLLTVVLTYQDATQTQTLLLADSVQMHRKQNGGFPNRVDYQNVVLSLRSSPVGSGGTLSLAVTGGCPDLLISPVSFLPTASSGVTYLGSSTNGDTTTYTFTISYIAPPATAVPWPITIQP